MMSQEVIVNGDEVDTSVFNPTHRHSSFVPDGTLLLKRKKSSAGGLIRRKESAKVILVGDNRVPFMSLYQVYTSIYVS